MRDRRAEQRQRTIDEIVETAFAVMAEFGAAGLSLGAIAKRMGMQTPSLYGYFPSKAALCDELFARSWRELADAVAPHQQLDPAGQLVEQVEKGARAFVDWALTHPAQTQLMLWRPITGWEPSAEAYAPAVEYLEGVGASLATAQEDGLLRADADIAEMSQVLTVLTTGVISQQLSNEPGVPMRKGTFAAHLPVLSTMFATAYAAAPRRRRRG